MKVSHQNGNNEIIWKTGSEINCDYYSILRSNDGITWEEIGIVEGNGTTFSTNAYSFTDEQIRTDYYYVIDQYDFNGETNRSWPIHIFPNQTTNIDLLISPNPAKAGNSITIRASESFETVHILNSYGAAVETIEIGYESNTFVLNTTDFSQGYYLISVESRQGISEHQKLIIQ